MMTVNRSVIYDTVWDKIGDSHVGNSQQRDVLDPYPGTYFDSIRPSFVSSFRLVLQHDWTQIQTLGGKERSRDFVLVCETECIFTLHKCVM